LIVETQAKETDNGASSPILFVLFGSSLSAPGTTTV